MSDDVHSQPEGTDAVEITEEAPQILRNNKVDFSKVEGNFRFYGNHASVSMTPFDLRLMVNDVDVVGGVVTAKQSLTLLMTPELATLIHIILGKSLENHAKNYGPPRLKVSKPPSP